MKKRLLVLALVSLLCFACSACSASSDVSSVESEQTSSESAPESSAASSGSSFSVSEAKVSASEPIEPQGGGTVAVKKPSEPDLSDYTEEELAELRYEEERDRIFEQYRPSADALGEQADALIPQEYTSFDYYSCNAWPIVSEGENGSPFFNGYNLSVTVLGPADPADAAGAQMRAAEIHQLLADNGITAHHYQYFIWHGDTGNRIFESDAPEAAPAPHSKPLPQI